MWLSSDEKVTSKHLLSNLPALFICKALIALLYFASELILMLMSCNLQAITVEAICQSADVHISVASLSVSVIKPQ